MRSFRNVESSLQKEAIFLQKNTLERRDNHRHFAAADFARSHMWAAVFSANCYFAYLSIFQNLADANNVSDVKTGAIDAAHLHADVVPIELFNAREVLGSPEVMELARIERSSVLSCFDRHFPNLDHARDAVAHSHDRLFGRFRNKGIADEIGSRVIASQGKNFLAASGENVLFGFRIEQFSELLTNLESMIIPQCA